MNNIYFPTPVVALLRRLVHIVSLLSLSRQFPLQAVISGQESESSKKPETLEQETWFWRSLRELSSAQWPYTSETPNAVFLSIHRAFAPTTGLTARDIDKSVPWWSWLQLRLPASASFASSVPAGTQTASQPGFASQSQLDVASPQRNTSSNGEDKFSFENLDIINRLMKNPTLYDPVRAPRYPIVLCHGLYGFDVRGPSAFPNLRMHYWSNVLSILRKRVGADVIVTSVPPTGSIESRSENLDRLLREKASGRGINFVAHSMGGLDCRHLITHVKPKDYTPLSLTTISTPHRGSPFMDWCAENIGLGRISPLMPPGEAARSSSLAINIKGSYATKDSSLAQEKQGAPFSLSLAALPSSFTTLLLSMLDSPAYANLTTRYLNEVFNPSTPDDPRVKYFSVTSRTNSVSVWHPFWLPKMVLDGEEEKAKEQLKREWEQSGHDSEARPPWDRPDAWGNDGLVTIDSARWGEFLGIIENCDHWEIRGARGMELNVEFPSVSLGSAVDGWPLSDWRKYVGAWRKQEEREGAKSNSVAMSPEGRSVTAGPKPVTDPSEDALVKSSTDKLSAVFDWLMEQVPAQVKLPSTQKTISEAEVRTKKPQKNELYTKLDLERFYVALSRKLYDEGL